MIKKKENKKQKLHFYICIKRLSTLFFTFAFLFLPFQLIAQNAPIKPKIGLVLSGGGAKGLAHIGVLKVIDSLGIKIDYIGGTSMGSIVGGLYASGYSAKQLDSIFSKLNTENLIQDNIPRTSKNIFEKNNSDKYAVSLPFRNLKIETPNALSKGIYNYNLFTQLTYSVKEIKDFSKLPIPFFCMATNIVTGEQKLLETGNLAQAITASGAIPSLYNPVNIDGQLYVDGGVLNNYPIEELKKKGVDFIIGVDVQDELKSIDELQSATKILLQISNINTLIKMENKIPLTNIYLKPNIKGFNMFSFEDGVQIIKNGQNEALSKLEALKQLITQSKPIKTIKQTPNKFYINNIEINDLERFTRAYVLGKLKLEPKSTITFKQLYQAVQSLNATQNFSSIQYEINKNNDLAFNLKENPINSYIKLAVHYDDLYKSGALVNYTQKKIISKNDIFSLDVVLGDNFRYDLSYLIDNGFYWSFGVNSTYNNFNRNITTEIIANQPSNFSSINVNYSSFSAQVFTQTVFLKKYQIGGGVDFQALQIASDNFNQNNSNIEFSNYLSAFAYLNHDTFDNKYFPNKGWLFNGNFKNYFYSSDFTNSFKPFAITNLQSSIAISPIKKLSIVLNAEVGFKIGSSSIPFYDFILGGYGFRKTDNIKPFFGYDFLSISGNSYWKASSTIDFEIFKKNHINITTNNAVIGDFIFNSTKDWINKPDITGYAIGYGIDTFIGPIEFKYSWSEQVRKNFFWFNVGFTF